MELDEAIEILNDNGYNVLMNEGRLGRFAAGAAIAATSLFGGATHANAATVDPGQHIINAEIIDEDIRDEYDIKDGELTQYDIGNLIKKFNKTITDEIYDKNLLDNSNDFKLVKKKCTSWNNAKAVYDTLKTADAGLANMFARSLNQQLNSKLYIAPKIQ